MTSSQTEATTGRIGAGLRVYLRNLVHTLGPTRVLRALSLVMLGTLADSVSLLLLVPLLQLVNGEATAPALRWLSDQGLRPGIGLVLSLFVAAMLVRAWLLRWRDMDLLAMRLQYVDTLRSELQSALARASWEHLVRLRHADVMHLMFDQLDRVNVGTHQLMQAVSGAGLALAGGLVLLTIAPLWTVALVLPLGALLYLLRHRLALTASMGGRLGRARREMLTSARDFLAGLKLVKSHAVEDRHLAELADRAQAIRDEQLQFARHQSNTRGWFEVGGALVLSALLYGATVWGSIGLPELLLMVLVFSRLLPVLRDGQLQAQQLAHMLPAFQDLQDWMAQCRARAEQRPEAPAARRLLRQGMTFEDVTLRHADDRPCALAGVSLTLKVGTLTALMGPSGAGKTTLADVALGLLAPTTGQVLVDGVALADGQARRGWRASVAYVAQDPYLFPGSIRDNLCWLSGPRHDAELWAALELADAAAIVRALGDGLDHRLGERGEGLSGGQRQRLALARALLCRPELLVLDEVSSQLDAASEERVLKALGALRGKVTILAIAHRNAASLHADRTVVLEHGRVVSDTDADALALHGSRTRSDGVRPPASP